MMQNIVTLEILKDTFEKKKESEVNDNSKVCFYGQNVSKRCFGRNVRIGTNFIWKKTTTE